MIFLGSADRSFLQLDEFLGRGRNTPSEKFITLQFASLRRQRQKMYKVEVSKSYYLTGYFLIAGQMVSV